MNKILNIGDKLKIVYPLNHKFYNIERKVLSKNSVEFQIEIPGKVTGGSSLRYTPKSLYDLKDNILDIYEPKKDYDGIRTIYNNKERGEMVLRYEILK